MSHQEATVPSCSSARVGFGASQTYHLQPNRSAILAAHQLETGPRAVVAGAPAPKRAGAMRSNWASSGVVSQARRSAASPGPVRRLRGLPGAVGAPWPQPTESGPPGRHCRQSVLSVTGSRHPRQLGQPAKGVRQVRRPWSTQDRALRWVTGQQNSQQGAQAGNVWHRVGGVSGQQPAKVGNGKPPNALFFVDRAAVIDPYHQDH